MGENVWICMEKKGNLYVGTSGWVYKSWHKIFYPPEIKKDFLKFYGLHYNSVEINASFYHLPKPATFKKWHSETPDDFVFSVKMSRYITHIKRLQAAKVALNRFFSASKELKDKFAVVLVQTPPLLKYDKKIFSKFCEDASKTIASKTLDVHIAFEPRHWSWFDPENIPGIERTVSKFGFSMVFAHSSVFPMYSPEQEFLDSPFVYVRFHGPREFAMSKYGKKELLPWAERIKKWLDKGKTVFAYFNDDAHGYAVSDAHDLKELCQN